MQLSSQHQITRTALEPANLTLEISDAFGLIPFFVLFSLYEVTVFIAQVLLLLVFKGNCHDAPDVGTRHSHYGQCDPARGAVLLFKIIFLSDTYLTISHH